MQSGLGWELTEENVIFWYKCRLKKVYLQMPHATHSHNSQQIRIISIINISF